MQKAHEHETGIDLFDFIYEVWRAKWLFLAIVAGALVLGFASAIPRMIAGDTFIAPVEMAKVEFSLNLVDDPLQRKFDQMIPDYLERLTADASLQLSNAESAATGVTLTPYTYRVGYSEGANIGSLAVSAPGAPSEYFERLDAAMQESAKQQVEDLRKQMVADLQTVADIQQGGHTGEVLSQVLFNAHRFLKLPGVQDGSFRFVRLRPMEKYDTAAGSSSGGLNRRLLIAGLAGCLLGAVVIMFRIAIERQRNRKASA